MAADHTEAVADIASPTMVLFLKDRAIKKEREAVCDE